MYIKDIMHTYIHRCSGMILVTASKKEDFDKVNNEMEFVRGALKSSVAKNALEKSISYTKSP